MERRDLIFKHFCWETTLPAGLETSGRLSFYNFSELSNFSFVEQNFKDMRTFALSCVYMAFGLFLFVLNKPTSSIPQFSLVGEN